MTIVFFTISVGSIVFGELANWATVVNRDALNLSRWYVLFIVTLIPGYVMYKIRKLDSRSAQLAKQVQTAAADCQQAGLCRYVPIQINSVQIHRSKSSSSSIVKFPRKRNRVDLDLVNQFH